MTTHEGDTHQRAEGSKPTMIAQARRVEGFTPPGGDFTYSVLRAEAAPSRLGERRATLRQRTRLRSGKLVGPEGRFLCECLIHNRSPSGCRLVLSKAAAEIPPALFFYDDQTELLFEARVVWRKDRALGLRLFPCRPSALYRSIAGAMRRKFYALSR